MLDAASQSANYVPQTVNKSFANYGNDSHSSLQCGSMPYMNFETVGPQSIPYHNPSMEAYSTTR